MRFADRLSYIEEKFLVYSLMFTTALIFVQIIMRYVVGSSLSWSEELTRYVFLWQIWIGASYAVSARKHLKIDVFVNHFKGNTKRVMLFVSLFLWLFFSAYLAVKGTELVRWVYRQEQLSPAMQIPMALPYMAIPVGGMLMIIKLVYEVKHLLSPGWEE